MLNTGVLLKKPYESDYNAYRRFLIANIHYGPLRLSAEIKTLFDELIEYQIVKDARKRSWPEGLPQDYPWLCEFDNHINRQCIEISDSNRGPIGPAVFSERAIRVSILQRYLLFEMSAESEELITKSKAVFKQCPECARIGYHTGLFDLTWISTCPVHHVRLEERCPDCKRQWPTRGSLDREDCLTCGARIPFSLLLERGAFDQDRYPGDLEVLWRAIQDPNATHYRGKLVPLMRTKSDTVSYRHTILFNQDEYPGYLSLLDGSYKAAFERMQIPLDAFDTFTFSEALGDERALSFATLDKREHVLQNERALVGNEIIENIAQWYGKSYIIEDVKACPIGAHRNLEDIFLTALAIWHGLTFMPFPYKGIGERIVPHFPFETFYRFPFNLSPPTPPQFFVALTGLETNGKFPTSGQLLPESISRLIYYADLWNMFIVILKYIDALKFYGKKYDFYFEVFDAAEKTVGSHEAIYCPIGFFSAGNGEIAMAIPSSYLHGQLTHLELLTCKPVQVKSNRS